MNRFSLKSGRPIARIYNNNKPGDVLRIDNKPDDELDKNFNYNILIGEMLSYEKEARRTVLQKDQNALRESIESESEPKNQRLKRIYNSCMEVINARKGKEFFLDDGILQPLPINIEDQVDNGFVVGPSGSGKSVYIAKWLIEYKHMFPKNNIFLFSRKSEDKAFDVIPDIKRVNLNNTFINFMSTIDTLDKNNEEGDSNKSNDEDSDKNSTEDEDSLNIFGNSCCIFDDIDTIPSKKIMELVKQLRDDMLETGRSKNIYVISTSHLILDYKNTKKNLNEANFITLYPSQGAKQQIKEMLRRYQSLTTIQIARILSLPSRWVTIYIKAPQYVIYETGSYFLD